MDEAEQLEQELQVMRVQLMVLQAPTMIKMVFVTDGKIH